MDTQLLEIRDQQRAAWNKFSPGWKKWDDLVVRILGPIGEQMISDIEPRPSDHILDIAAGTGEPGLTLAGMLHDGTVVLTDLADEMLVVARENAEKKGIANVDFRACDVCELPFEDNSFDAVSCRLGFMFFPDMDLAAREMHRVLKTDGRMATAVWGVPQKNFWVTVMSDVINRHMALPAPPPGGPGMFRCAQPGVLADILRNAGFKNVREKEVALHFNTGTVDTFWNLQNDVAAPVVAALAMADPDTRAKMKEEIYAAILDRFPDGNVNFDASALVVYGEK